MLFADAAVRLAGMAGAILGWRPDEFWSATPAELGVVIGALTAEAETASSEDLKRLMALYPDSAVFMDSGSSPE